MARRFLDWLNAPAGISWLDIGCGTGELTRAILETQSPDRVVGVDPSERFLSYAREHVQGERVEFHVGDAMSLPYDEEEFDAAVSGLVLNFLPDPASAIRGMSYVTTCLDGPLGAYVWDYTGKMQMIGYFWDAAVALDPAAAELDERNRFSRFGQETLEALFGNIGLSNVDSKPIDILTTFRDFDDYWNPFLGGQGPAPAYAMSLPEDHRATLRERLQASLPIAPDGSIELLARAWAVKGLT